MADNEAQDDPPILDEDGLLRRIPCWPDMYVFDYNINAYRPSTANFKDPELSVSLEKDLLEGGNTHSHLLRQFSGFGLVRVKAGIMRTKLNKPQLLARDPTAEDPHHAIVHGRKTKGDCNKLINACETIIHPTPTKE